MKKKIANELKIGRTNESDEENKRAKKKNEEIQRTNAKKRKRKRCTIRK